MSAADEARAEAKRRYRYNRPAVNRSDQAIFADGAEWQASRKVAVTDPVATELAEWVEGKRSWCDEHHGLPNEIELTARADEATIRLLMAKLDAAAALGAHTKEENNGMH